MSAFHLPKKVDLSQGRPPEHFFVPLVSHTTIEKWRADEEGCHDHTIPHNNWCAMTCTKMMLMIESRPSPTLDELFEHACAVGVYRPKLPEEGKGWKGMYHHEFARFLDAYGFSAQVRQNLQADALAMAIASGYYVIPSVSPRIRFPEDKEAEEKTGHVVLAYAYETDEDGNRIYRIQNCAGFESLNSQKGFAVSEKRFAQVFSGTATLVRSPLYSDERFASRYQHP